MSVRLLLPEVNVPLSVKSIPVNEVVAVAVAVAVFPLLIILVQNDTGTVLILGSVAVLILGLLEALMVYLRRWFVLAGSPKTGKVFKVGAHHLADRLRQLHEGLTSPEELWATNSRKRLLYRAVQELTGLNREIILLKEIQGLPLQEIASLLKVPLGTVKSRSDRARSRASGKGGSTLVAR